MSFSEQVYLINEFRSLFLLWRCTHSDKCFSRNRFVRFLSFKRTHAKIHQTFLALYVATLNCGMSWADQLPLCNYSTMTAGPSCHCQHVIACFHLTVKGFLLKRNNHCVSAQVMRPFTQTWAATQKCKQHSIDVPYPDFFVCNHLVTRVSNCCSYAWYFAASHLSITGGSLLSALSGLLPH